MLHHDSKVSCCRLQKRNKPFPKRNHEEEEKQRKQELYESVFISIFWKCGWMIQGINMAYLSLCCLFGWLSGSGSMLGTSSLRLLFCVHLFCSQRILSGDGHTGGYEHCSTHFLRDSRAINMPYWYLESFNHISKIWIWKQIHTARKSAVIQLGLKASVAHHKEQRIDKFQCKKRKNNILESRW
jgi:hypothetical protein